MRRRNATALAAAIFFSWAIRDPGQAVAAKEQSLRVQAVTDRGVLILADGRQLCLDGLWLGGFSPSKAQMATLKRTLGELIDGQPVRIDEEASSYDRYGCLVARTETADGVLLQRALLERGLALVKPLPSSRSAGDIDAWLALEEEARQAKVGLWHDRAMQPQKASAMIEHIGKTSLVEGQVVRISSNDRYVYLNFGKDWRTDFTVRLRQKLLKQSGIEPSSFDGKKLRVRGFVQEARGPLIDISHLKQIEVIP